MIVRKVGPVWDAANEGAAGAGADAAAAGTQNANVDGGGDQNGSAAETGNAFAALDEDTRGWLQTKGLGDVSALAKSARESEKLLGSAIRVPGKDATPEERDAFLSKLGRPAKAEDYKFTVPKELPEQLPYDGEKAKAFAGLAHQLGLTQEQSAKLHDFYVGEQVGAFKGKAEADQLAAVQKAQDATKALEAEWGPLDGATAAANFEIADQVFNKTPGGAEVLQELKDLGLVGANKEILSAPIAKMLAAIGTALYTEDGVLRGKTDSIENPFSDKSPNLTLQMKLYKDDPDHAKQLIAMVGKKPSDFGLAA